jgi:hypothetical protein
MSEKLGLALGNERFSKRWTACENARRVNWLTLAPSHQPGMTKTHQARINISITDSVSADE